MERLTFGRKFTKDEKKDTEFTKAQRDWIIERDRGHSQMRHYDEERGFYKNEVCPYDGDPCAHLNVHHIETRRTGGEALPENGITIFQCEHTGVCPSRRIINGKRK